MKNSILVFLLGIFVTISIAATVPNSFMTVKPAQPKSVVCFWETDEDLVVEKTLLYTTKGYITKSCNGAGSSGRWVIIMEKY